MQPIGGGQNEAAVSEASTGFLIHHQGLCSPCDCPLFIVFKNCIYKSDDLTFLDLVLINFFVIVIALYL